MTSLPEPLIITGKHLSTAFLLPDRKAASPPAPGRAVQVQGGSVAAVEDVSFDVPRGGAHRVGFWVQDESANGVWPRFGLGLPELCPDRLAGLKRTSRRAIGAVVGLVEGARGRTAGMPR